jgi:hypothetical protein
MTTDCNEMAAYCSQADVDNAFADYDCVQLATCNGEASRTRNPLLCIGCGSAIFTHNNTGGNEPGARICNVCGVVQPGNVIFEHMYNRSLPTRSSNYKRIHHWHERISQLMLMESTIPAEHMLAIGERLLDGSHSVISKDNVRAVLRSLGLQVYIEKWLQIIERCTGVMPPCPGPVVLQKLDTMFVELQRPFSACKLVNRRNFLNYNYVFCRLFQLMGCSKFCMFFPLIRSKPKLRALDEMWTLMASSIGWETPPLELVPAFSVKIEEPSACLQQLKKRLADSAQVEIPSSRLKREYQKCFGQSRADAYPRKKSPIRSDRSEQRPQTLALKLKRRRQTPEQSPQ